jgi:hypothetical protein
VVENMIIRGGTTVFRALRDDWFTLLFFSSLTVGAEYLAGYINEYLPLKHTSFPSLPLGLGDLAIGLVYMFGLPKELGVSHCALLCDRLD